MIAYLSGPISGHKNYKEHFAEAARKLAAKGLDVINPAMLGSGVIPAEVLNYEDILEVDLLLLAKADALVQLPGWENSRGANRELGFALGTGMDVYSLDDILGEGNKGHGTAGDL